MGNKMNSEAREVFICGQCTGEVGGHDQFCIHCGAVLPGYVLFCQKHVHTEATGVCIICQKPYCLGCAQNVGGVYLCNAHAAYDIYECMARVYGINDEIMAKYIGECLIKAGLHPVVISGKQNPLGLESLRWTDRENSKRTVTSLMDEFKVMVPCEEVMLAEETLRDLEFLPQTREVRS